MSTLRAFLEDPSRPPGTLSYHELQGFLFTVACAPEPVTASVWMPVVFGGHEPEYESVEEAQAVIGELMALYNLLNAEVIADRAKLPADCQVRADPIANFEHDAPLAQWCRGFVKGHTWLEESWREHFPPQASESMKAILIALQFFAYPQTEVDAILGKLGPETLPIMAASSIEIFPEAIRNYSYFGRRLQAAAAAGEVTNTPHVRGTKVGRNEPCPCGSGRKYKKCCGAAA